MPKSRTRKPQKGIWLRADKEIIIETMFVGLEDLQQAVGGMIELGATLPNGDTVWVDEEGMFKGYQWFTFLEGHHQPWAGNALITGTTPSGDSNSCKTKLADAGKQFTFMDLYTVKARIAKGEFE